MTIEPIKQYETGNRTYSYFKKDGVEYANCKRKSKKPEFKMSGAEQEVGE